MYTAKLLTILFQLFYNYCFFIQKTILIKRLKTLIPQKHYAFGVFLSLNYDVISHCYHQSMLISSYCGLPIFSLRMATS